MGALLSKSESLPFEGLSENDTVILIIGPASSGKSTFINTLVGEEKLKVGTGLEPCTKGIAHVQCTPEDGQPRIIFIDTPPFPKPEERWEVGESALEKKIEDWQKRAFGKKTRISGILYLYNSVSSRMRTTLPPAIHVKMFQNLCGDDFHERVSLVMTMWERVEPEAREAKQKALTIFWHSSSSVFAHTGTSKSAWDIVNSLLDDVNSLEVQNARRSDPDFGL